MAADVVKHCLRCQWCRTKLPERDQDGRFYTSLFCVPCRTQMRFICESIEQDLARRKHVVRGSGGAAD